MLLLLLSLISISYLRVFSYLHSLFGVRLVLVLVSACAAIGFGFPLSSSLSF